MGEQSVITGEREGAIPYTTKDLSRELSERRGVDTITVLPQKDFKIVVDGQEYEFTGPATVLINQD
ncbi:BC1881 family protein [Paenibacillus amylolyticus]|uniref:BC1881 family protein n=1 Tax=Paenibacillus amylolyticus TaxID=1451 RepID=UPI002100490E|nr:BC1881 family protein [Paenibacillus amylolyticus]